jgi:Cupin domain
MKRKLSRKGKVSLCLAIGLVTIMVGTALALSNISFTLGTIASYDFGAFGPGYPVPGTIQIQTFVMQPGDTIPWHYHKGVSYVILARGTLTEQHLVGPNQCESEELTAGSAFVEPAGLVHSVTNTGRGSAEISWATIFPQSDGIAQFSPQFKSGGVYPANPPQCR